MRKSARLTLFFICIFSLILFSCSSKDSSPPAPATTTTAAASGIYVWSWVAGYSTANQAGTYGATTGTTGTPGARSGAVSWIDGGGNLWLFGGYGSDSVTGNYGYLNDLWKFNGTNWTWVSGSKTANQVGTYGATTGTTGTPGARYGAVSWIDGSGNLWLFGGVGYDSTGISAGYLNDLWKYDGTNWTWVSGSKTDNQVGTYGAVTGTTGTPGARSGAVSWIDGGGNLWLFGGSGYDATASGYLNDLWKFNGTNWTWVSGSKTANQVGTYGASTGTTGTPGARYGAVSWIDGSGNLMLFGGDGYDSSTTGCLNDLWKFDGINWTWVTGSKTVNQVGTYGTMNVPDLHNMPGSRYGAVSWIDSSHNLWLFGGNNNSNAGNPVIFNDLWKFDGSSWTWVGGSKLYNQHGFYSTSGLPGSRYGAVSWINSSGYLWIFGGVGYDASTVTAGYLNDLWYYP